MRHDRLRQCILHSLTHHKTPQKSPYTSDPRYSDILGSSDRLLFAHPDPATRAPSRASSADDSTMAAKESTRSCTESNTRARPQSEQACDNKRSLCARVPQQGTTPGFRSPICRCMHCTRRLQVYEFPRLVPTHRCRHENGTCVYCLHNSVHAAFTKGGWAEARCLTCGEQMSEEEASRLVLLWKEETVKP
jgi:hypothetical protein